MKLLRRIRMGGWPTRPTIPSGVNYPCGFCKGRPLFRCDVGLSLGGSHGGNGNSSGRAPGRGTEGAGNERRGIGAKDCRAHKPRDTDPEWHTQRHRRHGPAAGPFLWDKPAVLVEPETTVRCADCGTESGKSDSQPSKTQA